MIQALKQRFARAVLRDLRGRCMPEQAALWNEPLAQSHIWQARFYDFLVYTKKKRMEKLHYMHRNPGTRGLVLEPEQWRWSSVLDYISDERGPVLVNELVTAEMKVRVVPEDDSSVRSLPTFVKTTTTEVAPVFAVFEGRGPRCRSL